MSDKDSDDDFVIPFIEGIYKNATQSFPDHPTRQYSKLTDINLTSAINSFVDTVGPANDIRASADKRTEWLRETHPNIEVVPPTGIPLDLQIEGGGRRVHVESELGGGQAVAKDRKKLTGNEVPADASVLYWREMSGRNLGKGFEDIRRESIGKDGVFVGVEEYLPKDRPVSEAVAHVVAFRGGEAVFDSDDVVEYDEEDEDEDDFVEV